MGRLALVLGWIVTLSLAPALPAVGQSRCADCHFANLTAPARDHLQAWDRSAHSRNNIGCEKCHGGDATTFEAFQAHRNILNSANPASPANRRNLPVTCGTCHAGPFVAFQSSRHFALLQEGNLDVPVCTTCHGPVGARRPSPKTLEAECRRCHGPKGMASQPERAEAARTLYEAVNELRGLLDAAKPLISHITDKTRRNELEAMYQQTQVPLTEAVQAGHEFVYDNLKERLATARKRTEALLGQLANPN